MSFLSPLALALGAAAAAAVFVLHLITTRRPPPAFLPTARFVPVSDARAVSRASRPTDLLLLAMRVLAVLLVGGAFARPVLDGAGPRVRSVVLLDISASVGDPVAALALARERLTPGGALVVFDTAAREVRADSAIGSGDVSRGALSPALIAGARAAARVARGADSVRLVVVSPVGEDAVDAATRGIRAGWPGGIEVVRTPSVALQDAPPPPRLVTPLADDPLAPALARRAARRGAPEVRVVRGAVARADSTWAEGAGRVLVSWPLIDAEQVAPDAALIDGPPAAAFVAPLARLALPVEGTVIARWRDGAPAATQRSHGDGCIRRIAVGIPVAGDLTLRAPFADFLEQVVAPCRGWVAPAMEDSTLQWLRGSPGAAAARPLAAGAPTDSPLAAWLLASALLLLLAELVVRRGRDG